MTAKQQLIVLAFIWLLSTLLFHNWYMRRSEKSDWWGAISMGAVVAGVIGLLTGLLEG
jgi:hypothetical protein